MLIQKMSIEQHIAMSLSQCHSCFCFRSEPYQEGATLSEQNANIRLRFLDGLKTPVYTDKNITSESDAAIRIGIFNGDNMIKEGLLSKLKIEILVLHGDFCNDCQGNWTGEEFNSQIVQGRDGHRFVLGGDCSVWLNNGEASFGRIRFKEGSSRTRSRKFVVGARVCMGEKTGVRVQEAVMKPVTVLDRRNEGTNRTL
uniref:Calmodulin binding protein-like N-terminal domain-containing protein n=1 Tax=Aegilops tauschii subsp. strangulata TaxID=200361 RepID=A0A453JZ94_AEGTS